MMLISARSAYLLLVPQGRALIPDRALISGPYFFFGKQLNVPDKPLIPYLLQKEQ